jgi:hypothetical protein
LPTEKDSKLFIIKEITTSSGVTAVQNIQLMSFYNFYDTTETPLLDGSEQYILDGNNQEIIGTERE